LEHGKPAVSQSCWRTISRGYPIIGSLSQHKLLSAASFSSNASSMGPMYSGLSKMSRIMWMPASDARHPRLSPLTSAPSIGCLGILGSHFDRGCLSSSSHRGSKRGATCRIGLMRRFRSEFSSCCDGRSRVGTCACHSRSSDLGITSPVPPHCWQILPFPSVRRPLQIGHF